MGPSEVRKRAINTLLNIIHPKTALYLAGRLQDDQEKDELISIEHIEYLMDQYDEEELIESVIYNMIVNSLNKAVDSGKMTMVSAPDGGVRYEMSEGMEDLIDQIEKFENGSGFSQR